MKFLRYKHIMKYLKLIVFLLIITVGQIANAKSYIVDTPVLNVRSCAGTNCKIVRRLTKGDAVNSIQNHGEWVEIKTENGSGYVIKKALKEDNTVISVIVLVFVLGLIFFIYMLPAKIIVANNENANEIYIVNLLLGWIPQIWFILFVVALFEHRRKKIKDGSSNEQEKFESKSEREENASINKKRTYYDVLQVSPNASLDEIKIAYRKMAMKYHPDHNIEKTSDKFLEINDAYEILKNIRKRKEYDASLINESIDTDISFSDYDEFYDSNENDDRIKRYYMDGVLVRETPFQNGKEHGISIYYFMNGFVQAEISFEYGKKNGLAKEYYSNGLLKTELSYKYDILSGQSKVYYKNGNIKTEAFYKNGKLEGGAKNYYQSGELKAEGYFKNGMHEGVVKAYYKSGATKGKSMYNNGKLHGLSVSYYENGNCKEEAFFEKGNPIGEYKEYDKKGILKNVKIYENGQLKQIKHFKNGKIVSIQDNIDTVSNIVPLEKLYKLITLMAETPVYTEAELKELRKKDEKREQQIIEKMMEENISWGEASGEYEFLNQSEEEFKIYLKSINNDLDVNVEITRYGFEKYIERGEAPLPYYAKRIAIILSKNRLYKEEKEFLYEWYRHFQKLENCGASYKALVERARKKGAI